MAEVKRFFEDYKALEDKNVVVEEFLGPTHAVKSLEESISLYLSKFANSAANK